MGGSTWTRRRITVGPEDIAEELEDDVLVALRFASEEVAYLWPRRRPAWPKEDAEAMRPWFAAETWD